jgi:hypothetical protein
MDKAIGVWSSRAMRVPSPLSTAFGAPFEELISRFATEQKLMSEATDIQSRRFLARSVVPHVEKLSGLFNRDEKDQGAGLARYWKESSNPANLRLAYFLYFMPSNLYRAASVWAELRRLGFEWRAGELLKGIELGAGPASGACGIAAGERHAPVGMPSQGNWALIEQDKPMLELGSRWAEAYFRDQGRSWDLRPFHRTLDFKKPLLPPTAPRFNVWLMSYVLNEIEEPAEGVASRLLDAWDKHLEDESVMILIEPALKLQSRRLLELRRCLLDQAERRGADWLKLLLPCLGNQACGALAEAGDWCHEEVSWWRPPYFRVIDQMAGLDRKTLPFSYLVFARSARAREEILPELRATRPEKLFRLVSPSHSEGKDLEFFVCGAEGKRRARYRPPAKSGDADELDRGDVIGDVEMRGDVQASRIQSVRKIGKPEA